MTEPVLAFCFIASNVFWAIVVHRLINKLMSKNFAEYHQVVAPQAHAERPAEVPSEDPFYGLDSVSEIG